jgi:hypothetical protein
VAIIVDIVSAMNEPPTAVIAALGLIAGFAAAEATGSRPLGGVVLLIAGIWCISVWLRRDGPRTTWRLAAVGFVAFVASHVLGLAIGAWPAVLTTAIVVGAVYWRASDARARPRPTVDALP